MLDQYYTYKYMLNDYRYTRQQHSLFYYEGFILVYLSLFPDLSSTTCSKLNKYNTGSSMAMRVRHLQVLSLI